MTAVRISGTFRKDDRPDNGLEAISNDLVKDEYGVHYIVAEIVPHATTKKPGESAVPTIRFRRIEVVGSDDELAVKALISKRRMDRGVDGETLTDSNGNDPWHEAAPRDES